MSRVRLVGGTYSPEDESGDAHLFSRRLEEMCLQSGVKFLFQTTAQRFVAERNRITALRARHVEGREEMLRADAYLVCLGSYTPGLVRSLGIRVPVYPVKGYSVTIPVEDAPGAPSVCMTDETAKLAISRLGSRLRVAGTAELGDYDSSINPFRLHRHSDAHRRSVSGRR